MTSLRTERLVKRFGGITATDQVSLDVQQGTLHALIGPNGAGKTTLIAQLSGLLKPDSGRVLLDGQDITGDSAPERVRKGLTRTFQITSVFPRLTVLDNVAFAVQATVGHSFRFWRDVRQDSQLRTPAMQILQRVGIESRAEMLAQAISHGERRQLEIAMALATHPTVLLLDEPMAGMGPEESSNMVELLQRLKQDTTIVLVEHDMDVVFALADHLSVLVYGQLVASGQPDVVRREPAVVDAYLGSSQ